MRKENSSKTASLPWWFPRSAALYAIIITALICIIFGYILTLPPFEPPTFDIFVTPPSVDVQSGDTTKVSVFIDSKNGYDLPVALSTAKLPPNVDIFFSNNVGNPPFRTTANIFVRKNASTSQSLITIIALGAEGIERRAIIGITILSPIEPIQYSTFDINIMPKDTIVRRGDRILLPINISTFGFATNITKVSIKMQSSDKSYRSVIRLNPIISKSGNNTRNLLINIPKDTPGGEIQLTVSAIGEDGAIRSRDVMISVVDRIDEGMGSEPLLGSFST